MSKTDSIKVRLDNETKHLLVAAGIIHAGTGRKVKSAGDLSEFVRHCIKYSMRSDGTKKLTPAEVAHRYWNLKRLALQEEEREASERMGLLITKAAEQERIHRAVAERDGTIKYHEELVTHYER